MKVGCITIFIFFALFLTAVSDAAARDTIYATATPTIAVVGQQVTVVVSVASPDQSMNAVSGTLSIPGNLSLIAINRGGSIIDFWTDEPRMAGGRIRFEGIVLNPGYQGSGGRLFTATFEAKKEGNVQLYLSDGTVLANDGLGSNILDALGSTTLRIAAQTQTPSLPSTVVSAPSSTKTVALPVITDYSAYIDASAFAYVRGKGEPGALTKIVFKDTSRKSIGEQFIESLQTKRKRLESVLVKNNPSSGEFEYLLPGELVAGAYNATPFLVDESSNTEKPGFGVQLFVSDSKIVRVLVVVINVLALLIPVVGLGVLIYFIPWYSFRRMRVIRRKLGLEENKLELSQHQLKREDSVLEHTTDKILSDTQ